MDFLKELEEVSEIIGNIILNDDFPSEIIPQHLKQAVLQYPISAGKRLRPALIIWCCGLLGGKIEKSYYAATATEIYHNWTLVHDDIIDNDDLRRGKPATHTTLNSYAKKTYNLKREESSKFGNDFAILAGDLQQSWSISLLHKSLKIGVSAEVVLSLISDLVNTVSRELISGEAIDVELSYKNIQNVTQEEVEEMIYLKTASLLNFSAVSGGKIALELSSNKDKRISKLEDYASALGIAFQLKDDWLGIYSDTEELGKPVGSDIIAAKPTILILEALKQLDNNNKNELLSFLGRETITIKDMEQVRCLITKSGAEENILKKIEQLHNYAEKAIQSFPNNRYKKILFELNNFLINRTK